MAPSAFRMAMGAVKDQTSIGLAKVTTATSSHSALEVAIVRATRHDEYPPDEKPIRKILTITAHSHALVGSCITLIARRLSNTRNWAVALKTLMLVHRLLSKGNRAYEPEIFFSTRRGARFLNMSAFRDAAAHDYSAFVRAYAIYLDEGLEFRMQERRAGQFHGGDEAAEGGRHGGSSSRVGAEGPTPIQEMKNEGVFSRIDCLRRLLERFLACRPTGAAQYHRIVVVAFYLVVKESFQLYYDMTEALAILIERFMQLDIPDMERAHDTFCRVSKQLNELIDLYEWCKTVRIVRSSECPCVDKIPQQKLDTMDDFIRHKFSMLHNRKARTPEPAPIEKTMQPEPEPQPKDDTHDVKALPPLEASVEDNKKEGCYNSKKINAPEMGNLLDLSDDGIAGSMQKESDELVLALFGSSGDWETALVESASQLSSGRTAWSFGQGLDMMALESMYAHGSAVVVGPPAAGSASSMVSVARPAGGMLALPAATNVTGDPFAASLAVAPPAYVQMWEMERKQRLLVEEQMMWQQFARQGLGRQGEAGGVPPHVGQQYSNPYAAGGYMMW